MENSNVLAFTNNQNKMCDFNLMHNLLRYVYASKKSESTMEPAEPQEQYALNQTYYCRAALKRRLKQIALYEHELNY
ncbi:hypothetical protein MNBD_GAMMA22-1010 [hydrothermal vent metagenome]|uniref:Uncharacterized protein n=1 Tax=hydrothermal vent metagenome TaxID=652676 RepID=A0A3B1A9S7_9ZZZZ